MSGQVNALRVVPACLLATSLLIANPAAAQKKYDPGASDTEIKVGNIMPYSGPASAYGTAGKVQAAYLKMINDNGGVHGRKVTFISYDDAFSPPKAIEQARKLVESDEVLLIFSPLGTASNTAIHKYMNQKKVPQLFASSGAAKWGDPKNFPWTIGWQPPYPIESRIYAQYMLETRPSGKIAVLYQNDDYGKEYVKGLRDALGTKASMIVAEASYEVTDPTVDSQIITLKSSGADIFFNVATPKFAAQAIKRMAEVQWKPLHILNNVAAYVGTTMKPAGFENAQGIISSAFLKDPTDPQWRDDPGMKEWSTFMDKYYPEGNKTDSSNVFGYILAKVLVQVLTQCGDELTRKNVMTQAANLTHVAVGQLLPGITVNTSPTDFQPLEQLQMMRFEGGKWVLFGPVR